MARPMLPDLHELTGDPTDPRWGDPSLNQMPTDEDWREADAIIRRNVDAMPDEALGVAEEWDGELAHLSELYGELSARQIMRDRAAQAMTQAADRTIAGASRADFQQARAAGAQQRQRVDEMYAEWQRRYPDLSDTPAPLVEAAARRTIASIPEGVDPQTYIGSEDFMADVSAELRYPSFEAEADYGRTAIVPGDGGGHAPQMPQTEEPGDFVEDLGRWQRSAGLR